MFFVGIRSFRLGKGKNKVKNTSRIKANGGFVFIEALAQNSLGQQPVQCERITILTNIEPLFFLLSS